MSENRNNPLYDTYKYMELINKLRTDGMTRADIKDFLTNKRNSYDKATVCDKTVQRRIQDLQKQFGKDFCKDEYDVYHLNLCNFPDSITEQDILAVDIAIKQANNDNTIKQSLQDLKTKLSNKLHQYLVRRNEKRGDVEYLNIQDKIEQINFIHIGPRPEININQHVLDILSDAVFKHKRISFKYYRYNTDNVFDVSNVCPLGFLHGPNNKYCVVAKFGNDGFADLSNIVKYKLEQISNIQVLDNKLFRLASDFSIENYANSMFGVYSEDNIYDIEWFVPYGDITKEILRYTFHPTQSIIKNDDGSLNIKFHCGGLKHIAKYLAQWEGKIIPVAPQELVDEYRNLLNTCLSSINNKDTVLLRSKEEFELLYNRAKEIVIRDKNTTISHLQQELSIDYALVNDLIERMEHDGIISAPDTDYKRHIL